MAEQDRYWWDRSAEAVAGDPVRWVGLLSRKAAIFWNAFESSNNKDLDHFTAVSLPSRHYRGWFGALLCLGCAGLAVSLRRPGSLMILSLMTGYWIAVSLFFTTARYRLPLVPFLAILAAVGAVEAVRRVRERNARGLAVMAAAVAMAAAAVFPPWFLTGEKRINPEFQMGQIFLSRGEPGRAEEHLLRAKAARGGDPDVLNSLGAARFATQDWQGAERYYLAALASGEFSEIYYNLGVVNEKKGPSRKQEAIDAYRRSLERNPLEARARANLGYLLGYSRP
jgi:tetratricopeptide (TPR) repeat protein